MSNKSNQLATVGDSDFSYRTTPKSHLIVAPYSIDSKGSYVLDQNGEKTIYGVSTIEEDFFRILDELGISAKKIDCFAELMGSGVYPILSVVRRSMKSVLSKIDAASKAKVDPLILDLDGDGYNVETKEDGAYFDLDGNGFAERLNWTKRDGFLCLDLNGNGSIDSGAELFGDNTVLADGTLAKNGFEALAQYDTNGDGVIDAGDSIFDSLRVWIDADGNGKSEEGELRTLAELGISSINLSHEISTETTGTEAAIGNEATFTYADGTVSKIGELWVSKDLFDTIEAADDVDVLDDIATIANVRSIGNVSSLHTAMALDKTGRIKAIIEEFSAEPDAEKRLALVEELLFKLCGADSVNPQSRGGYMNAKQLAVIEALTGEAYVGANGANPNSSAAPILVSVYQDLLNIYYNELNAQTHLKKYVALLGYTENEDGTKRLNADALNFVLEYQLKNNFEGAEQLLTDIARYVAYLDNGGISGLGAFAANYAAISFDYAVNIARVMSSGLIADGKNILAGETTFDFLVGSENSDTIRGYGGDDILIGGAGDDALYGGTGNDTYIFNLGDGNDTIDEQNSNSANDTVIFGEGIRAEDIVVTRDGNDMVLKIGDNDSIRIYRQYCDSWYHIENFVFADGTTVNVNDYLNTSLTISGSGTIADYTSGYGTRDTTLIGSEESDKIYGYGGDDILIGGAGDDALYGGTGNDTYIFNLGDGNDTINEQNANSENDRILFGEGISARSLYAARSGNDLVMSILGTDDTITVTNHFSSVGYAVENFELSDGQAITNVQLNQLIQSMASFENETGMMWNDAVAQNNETAMSIIDNIWVQKPAV